MSKIHTRLAFVLFAATAFPAPALAQDSQPAQEPAGGGNGFDISATATVVSDYRFRGVSESGRDPALQGSVDISYHGFYAGAWGSSIARTADTHAELDLYAGYTGSAGPLEYDVGVIAYLYPGGDGTGNIYEGKASLSYTFGPATGKLSMNYAPDQENLAGDNLYINGELRVGIPTTPFTAFASVGRERGSFYGRKWDWTLGVQYSRGPFTASLAYVDTNLNSATSFLGRDIRAGVVASAGIEF
jgi:uncharacterized protein (TIGR02001 family)